MKKLLFILTLLCGLGFTANAQKMKAVAAETSKTTVKLTPTEASTIDANELKTLLNLDDVKTADFQRLFYMKYETLSDESLSAERKSVLKTVIEAKIRASLDQNQIELLEKNPTLFERLK